MGCSAWYGPGEPNKPGRKDEQESERLHSTDEAGELISARTPWREGGRRVVEPLEGNMPEALNSDTMSTKLQRIAALAQQNPQMAFTSLNHLIDFQWLCCAYARTRKDGAVGVDGQTAAEYEELLADNLQRLLVRAKAGTYRAPPVRRVYIPKGPNSQEKRPIGIPTFEDKILQRAVAMALEPIYEQDFLTCSYGFRPGRSAHQALQALWQQLAQMGGGWVLDVDVRKFFDTLGHSHLRALIQRRVRDGVLLRLIDKWLSAGVLDKGQLSYPEAGSPQGGVISPVLSNIYLHYVLDDWFEQVVRPRLRGHAFLIRYADDLVVGFAREADARRVMEVLPKRFSKYGLAVHPDKTRLVPFLRPVTPGGVTGSESRPGTFDFLGFTHYWGRSRKGSWIVKRQTAANRLRRATMKVAAWCRCNRHRPIPEQHEALSRKLHGHYAYYGITGNARSLAEFYFGVRGIWRRWLARRSWASPISWDEFQRVAGRFPLPPPVIVHSVYRCS
jgi:RNA-directed DNA polymerase